MGNPRVKDTLCIFLGEPELGVFKVEGNEPIPRSRGDKGLVFDFNVYKKKGLFGKKHHFQRWNVDKNKVLNFVVRDQATNLPIRQFYYVFDCLTRNNGHQIPLVHELVKRADLLERENETLENINAELIEKTFTIENEDLFHHKEMEIAAREGEKRQKYAEQVSQQMFSALGGTR